MQEDINNRTASLVIQTTRLTARTFKRLLEKALAEMKTQQRAMNQRKAAPKTYKGKQSVKQLVGQGAGVSNIEITDKNIKSFERTARKYGVDFAVKRDNNAQPPKYLVFFKANKIYNQNKRQYKCNSVPATDWNEQTKAEEWRAAWVDCVNATLEKQDIAERIDHRSFERQGIFLS